VSRGPSEDSQGRDRGRDGSRKGWGLVDRLIAESVFLVGRVALRRQSASGKVRSRGCRKPKSRPGPCEMRSRKDAGQARRRQSNEAKTDKRRTVDRRSKDGWTTNE